MFCLIVIVEMPRQVERDDAIFDAHTRRAEAGETIALSLVVSNEVKQELWEPFLKNLGGGYARTLTSNDPTNGFDVATHRRPRS